MRQIQKRLQKPKEAIRADDNTRVLREKRWTSWRGELRPSLQAFLAHSIVLSATWQLVH